MTQTGPSVGIIGLGYGRAHIPGFQINGCRVVAVCQRDRAAAKTLADRYGVPQVYERWEELLERARPEIVVVATPPHLHHPIVTRALAAGAHVLCEKPLALNTAEARAMVEAASCAGRIAMTGFNWRFTAALAELDAQIREGTLGRILHVTARWLGGRWADETTAPTWRMDRAQAGFGAMGDAGVHVVDLLRVHVGEFRRLVAHAGIAYPARSAPGIQRPADADDYCTVLAELDGGVHAAFSVSRVAHGTNEQSLDVYGTRGAAHYRLLRTGPRWWDGQLELSAGGRPATRIEPRTRPDVTAGEGDPFDAVGRTTIALLVRRLLDGIRTGATPSPSLEDGVRAQTVLDAVVESTARAEWVEVPG